MKRLLKFTAIIEALTGLALIAAPDLVVRLLLGADINSVALPLGRIAGVALLALGAAFWFASHDVQSRTARGIVGAMLIYNVGAVLVLGVAGVQMAPVGIALWPAVAVHAVIAILCVANVLTGNPGQADSRRKLR